MALSSSFPASRRFPRGCTHPLSYNDHTRQKRTVRSAACGVWWFRWWVVFLNQFVKVVLTGVLSDYPACPVVAGWVGVTGSGGKGISVLWSCRGSDQVLWWPAGGGCWSCLGRGVGVFRVPPRGHRPV